MLNTDGSLFVFTAIKPLLAIPGKKLAVPPTIKDEFNNTVHTMHRLSFMGVKSNRHYINNTLHADWKNADICTHLAMLLLQYGFQSILRIILILGVAGGLVRQIGVHTSHSDGVVYIQAGGRSNECLFVHYIL